MRLDKFLADMEWGTRKELKALIDSGRVTVDGVMETSPKRHIDEHKDVVCVDGKEVQYEQYVYYMLNKPAGYVTATKDSREKTVMELLPPQCSNLFPVGRLDKDTEGLLLFTNNGELAHRMLSPKKHVDKEYYVEVTGCLTEEAVQQFSEGIDIGEDKLTLPAKLQIQESTQVESKALVTIREGKFHQIKRMFKQCGHEVTYLKRLRMGPIELDNQLALGEYKKLGDVEWVKNIMQ